MITNDLETPYRHSIKLKSNGDILIFLTHLLKYAVRICYAVGHTKLKLWIKIDH